MSLEIKLAVARRLAAGGVTRQGFSVGPSLVSLPKLAPTPSPLTGEIPAPRLPRLIETPPEIVEPKGVLER